MTNGNFGGPPSGGSGQGFGAGGGFGAPPQGGGFGAPPAGGGFGPPPGGNFGAPPGGGFGGPPGGPPRAAVADFSAAMDVFKNLMGQLVPSGLLGGFLVIALGALVANIPLWVAQYLRISSLQALGSGDIEALAQKNLLADVLSVLGGGLMLLVLSARLGLARPMRMIALEGPASVTGTGDVLRLALGRFGPNLAIWLVYAIAVAAGSMCCLLPGLAAAVLLYPATYLVATERDFGGSFSMGVNWLQRHPGALLGTVGILVAIAVVFGCCNCGFHGVAVSRFGPMTAVYMLPGIWFFGELVGVVTFTFLGSGCIAADRAEMAAQQQQRSAGPF